MAIDHEDTFAVAEDFRRSLSASIDREDISDELSASRVVVAMKDPYETALRAIFDPHRRLVGEDDIEITNSRRESRDERPRELGGVVHEIIHRASRDRNSKSRKTLFQAGNRNRVRTLRDSEVGDKTKSVLAASDDLRGQRCCDNALATGARFLFTLVHAPNETSGLVFGHASRGGRRGRRRFPEVRTLHVRHVDPVEQHRELFAIVKSWELDPFTGDIFAFIGKRADRVKLLAWHRNPSWPQRMSIGCDARYTRVRGGSASIAYRLSNARTSRARSHST